MRFTFFHGCLVKTSFFNGTVQYRTRRYSTEEYMTMQCSTQNGTNRYRTVRYGTKQYSKDTTVQSSVDFWNLHSCSPAPYPAFRMPHFQSETLKPAPSPPRKDERTTNKKHHPKITLLIIPLCHSLPPYKLKDATLNAKLPPPQKKHKKCIYIYII